MSGASPGAAAFQNVLLYVQKPQNQQFNQFQNFTQSSGNLESQRPLEQQNQVWNQSYGAWNVHSSGYYPGYAQHCESSGSSFLCNNNQNFSAEFFQQRQQQWSSSHLENQQLSAQYNPQQQQQQQTATTIHEENLATKSVRVPAGWKRLVSVGTVLYFSPSGSRLGSLQEAAAYLQQDGTCKCGLPCPLHLGQVFNFNPLVLSESCPQSSTETHSCCLKRPAASAASASSSKDSPLIKSSKSNKTAKQKKPSSPAKRPRIQQQQQLLPIQRKSPCPNVDVRLLPQEQNRLPAGSLLPRIASSIQQHTNPATTTITTTSAGENETLLADLLDCIPDYLEQVLEPPTTGKPALQKQQLVSAERTKCKDSKSSKKSPRSKTIQTTKQHTIPVVPATTNVRPTSFPVTLITSSRTAAPSGQLVQFVSTLTTPAAPVVTTQQQLPVVKLAPLPKASKPSKKRKTTPQTVASILQRSVAQHPPPPQPQQTSVVYNVQSFQQLQQVSTLALMPDGKTYVVLNSPAAAVQTPQSLTAASQWVVSPRPQQNAFQTLIAAATPQNNAGANLMQPVNLLSGFCAAPVPTTIVLQSPVTQPVLLHDGNVIGSYGGVFVRCPATPTPLVLPAFTPADDGVTSSSSGVDVEANRGPGVEVVACGEATPPQPVTSVRKAQPSPVVQSSHIDSCVQEDDSQYVQAEMWNEKPATSAQLPIENAV